MSFTTGQIRSELRHELDFIKLPSCAITTRTFTSIPPARMPPSTFLERQSTAIRAPDAAKLLTNDTLSFLAHARSADDQVSALNTMPTRRCTGLRTQGPLASQGRSYLGGLLVESGSLPQALLIVTRHFQGDNDEGVSSTHRRRNSCT